ncbi:MAG: RsmB/NOP family class I SAM-dependent RNA methyltransferase [Pseudomonadota bacterium]
MRDPGRVGAAVDVLSAFKSRSLPLSILMNDWARNARFAGSKDRAFVRGLCLDVLRRWRSFNADSSVRCAVFLTLRDVWNWESTRVEAAFAGDHGPGWLTTEELAVEPSGRSDIPAFCEALEPRLDPNQMSSLLERAPVDLRANTLKASPDKVLKALTALGAEHAPLSVIGLRIPPPPAADKGPGVTVIPAFGKGWVEVQDEGSQLTVLAAGPLDGAQVLDLCAGAGGKTLALAASMDNKGQIHAYDAVPERLAPIHERLRRAGARNVQVIGANERDRLEKLRERMDFVFVDAPCSGSGTWRRHPDTKWRLTPEHLVSRQEEQDDILREAASFVKPGGILHYVTCSYFEAENEDRIQAFLLSEPGFALEHPLAGLPEGTLRDQLEPFATDVALRLAPWSSGTDAFTVLRLRRQTG